MWAVKKEGSGFRAVESEKDIDKDEVFSETMPEIKRDLMADASCRIQSILDGQAQKLGYDSMVGALTYLGDPNKTFSDEAKKLQAWRSSCWVAAFAVKKPKSVADIVKALPKYEG